MTTYLAPTRDMRFVIEELAGLDRLTCLPGYEDATPDLVEAILDEAAKLASEVLAPLNKTGDTQGVRLEAGSVFAADGFKEAYQQFVEGGWNGISGAPDYGGQGLPELVLAATVEIWNAANMSFALCPLLNAGATEALKQHGSDALKAQYLP
ncbi:MAG TPA: acyl-CoA dehydrogenase N-terminal domain-containing protein, partial [Candidatus Competibacter sp.]|nr:acyl-CoA dehydrogenase N-terminal domain-containing protein [Candidatus Competibacter sp.]